MRRVMGAVAVVVLAGAISKAMGDYRENAADAVGEQVERAMLAADQVAPADGKKWHFGLEGMWMYGLWQNADEETAQTRHQTILAVNIP